VKRRPAVLLHLTLAVGAVLTLIPLLWMVSASFMPTGDATLFPPHLVPRHPTWDHYRVLFTRLDVTRAFLNSAVVSVGATLVSLVLNGMAGYAFAKLRFSGRERAFQILLAALVIPAQVAMLPMFLELKTLGLVNTLLGAMIPGFAGVFGIFLVRQYALSIPDELLDAARLDGAGEWRIFRSVVLPVLAPILATLGTFTFLSMWNDFLWPLIVLTDASHYTLPVALAGLSGEHVQDTELMMAGSVVTVLPAVLVFLSLQRAYVRGVLAGGVKG
jgi:multiple sugar transport system permease protein